MELSKIYLFVVLALLNTNAFSTNISQPANKGIITGEIIDTSSNLPIEYANISIYSVKDSSLITGCITNQKGEFSINNIPYGEYFLSADFIGYQKSTVSNIIISKKHKEVNIKTIKLSMSQEQLAEIEVTADKNYVDYKVDKKVVNVSQHINATGGTAAEVLESVPSVNVDIEGNVTLRGSGNFTVLVDGRPSPLSSNDILKQIPANAIENIEIITNPSAKYDPDGTSGIINIIMKKNRKDGVNGIVSVNASSNLSYGGTANINIRKNKVNFFVNGNYNIRRNPMTSTNIRETYFTDTIGMLNENTKRVQTMNPWRLNSGLDYYINDNNLLTFSASYGGFGFYRTFDTKYESFSNPETNREYSISDNNFEVDGVYYAANLGFEHKFKKEDTKLEFESSAWQWVGNNFQESYEQTTDNNWNTTGGESKVKTLNIPVRNNLRTKLDYSMPLFTGKFEAGLQTMLTGGDTKYSYHDYNFGTDEWIENTSKKNNLEYFRAIHSAYATYYNKFAWFEYQVGLRVEYTDRKINQTVTNEQYNLNLFNYYPTIHLSKQINEKQQVQLSYSKRISRPRPWELNPFPDYADRYNVSYGNPMLEPEDIDSYEFNYVHRLKKIMISTGLYYRQTNNTKIFGQEINSSNPEIMTVTYFNLDKTQAYGLEFNLNYNITSWFVANLGGNFYRYEVSDAISEQSNLTSSNKWDSRINTIFKIKKKMRLQFTYIYQGPGVNGQGYQYESYMLNAAVKYDFLKNRATLTFNVQDIFATAKYETQINNSNFSSYFLLKSDAPVFRINLSYRINNYKRRAGDNTQYR